MKFFARGESGKKSLKLFGYGWKIGLLVLVAVGFLSVLLFYASWAATFDMKKVVGSMQRMGRSLLPEESPEDQKRST